MSPGPTFDRVYLAIKEQLTSGRFAPGDHLEPATIGEELNASITPVRDALHRLVGERMVEAPRNDGFRVPAPLEAELRELYGWSGQLLELAIRSAGFRSAAAAPGEAEVAFTNSANFFRHIARLTGNAEHEAAVENLNDRLAALRIAEGELLQDLGEELIAVQTALRTMDLAGLRRLLSAYHRRRQRRVPEILATARRGTQPR